VLLSALAQAGQAASLSEDWGSVSVPEASEARTRAAGLGTKTPARSAGGRVVKAPLARVRGRHRCSASAALVGLSPSLRASGEAGGAVVFGTAASPRGATIASLGRPAGNVALGVGGFECGQRRQDRCRRLAAARRPVHRFARRLGPAGRRSRRLFPAAYQPLNTSVVRSGFAGRTPQKRSATWWDLAL
jgi:hypothetical protein